MEGKMEGREMEVFRDSLTERYGRERKVKRRIGKFRESLISRKVESCRNFQRQKGGKVEKQKGGKTNSSKRIARQRKVVKLEKI